ncbi:n- gnat [Fusarium albosuccineum]|uniref:N- gnat n=1 Tax=Fusarium albosuccineum TaxID=1237068 RepID=A0A8H4L9N7_9HYPO|nr:n- gnat [Fusarium albosuccineum]
MSPLQPAEPIQIQLNLDEFQQTGVTPWFSYSVTLPERPIPSLAERPPIKTQRLVLRPLTEDDLDAFHELRSLPELQLRSKTRGRPHKDREETKEALDRLLQQDQTHWYYGAFLQSTGELIGEGGMPDCEHMVTSTSGWPEAEFFIKPEHWRQGYGTEFFNAIMQSWWSLPRERRRHQLIPVVAPDKEPGDEVLEGVVFEWEEPNDVARAFFAKVLQQAPVFAEGGYESIDAREGRVGDLVQFSGSLVTNPRPFEDKIEE